MGTIADIAQREAISSFNHVTLYLFKPKSAAINPCGISFGSVDLKPFSFTKSPIFIYNNIGLYDKK